VMVLLRYAGDDAARATLSRCDVDAKSYWQWCCRVMLVTVLQFKVVLVCGKIVQPPSSEY
jgi:hypothetical protein